MWNEPNEEELKKIPKFYETEEITTKEKMIYLHFFIGASDWYVVEYDETEQQFFGFVILNNDFESAEWGYFSFQELKNISLQGVEIDRDLHWEVRPAKKVNKIKKCKKLW